MKHYILFDAASGEITRSGSCPDGDLEKQKGNRLEGEARAETHYVLGGVIVGYTAEQASAKAVRHSIRSTWDNATMQWVDMRTVEDRLRDAASDVRSERLRRLNACDWIIMQATEASVQIPLAWRQYRQALRDIPLQPSFPFNVVWPVEP